MRLVYVPGKNPGVWANGPVSRPGESCARSRAEPVPAREACRRDAWAVARTACDDDVVGECATRMEIGCMTVVGIGDLRTQRRAVGQRGIAEQGADLFARHFARRPLGRDALAIQRCDPRGGEGGKAPAGRRPPNRRVRPQSACCPGPDWAGRPRRDPPRLRQTDADSACRPRRTAKTDARSKVAGSLRRRGSSSKFGRKYAI